MGYFEKEVTCTPNYPTNTIELFNVLQSEWLSIPDESFTKLVPAMPTRVSLDKLNRGKSTKY